MTLYGQNQAWPAHKCRSKIGAHLRQQPVQGLEESLSDSEKQGISSRSPREAFSL